MKQKSGPGKAPAEQVLKDIRRQTRRHYSAEEKIRIVLEGYMVRRTSPSFAVGRALLLRCIMAGPGSSLRSASADWPATQPAPQLLAR